MKCLGIFRVDNLKVQRKLTLPLKGPSGQLIANDHLGGEETGIFGMGICPFYKLIIFIKHYEYKLIIE